MAIQNTSKLNYLEQSLPEGLLIDASWMEQQGYSRSLRKQYVDAGWLQRPAHGVFRRPRGNMVWEQVVISLQCLLNFPVSVGGRTALEEQGYAHYLPQSQNKVHLYTQQKVPGWLGNLTLETKFAIHNRGRFLPEIAPAIKPALVPSPIETSIESTNVNSIDELLQFKQGKKLQGHLQQLPWGQFKWPLTVSTPERAILELLDELPKAESFHGVDVIMESLVNVRPASMQALLEDCTSIKVKRLFFFFADRHQHGWLHHIEKNKIGLGKGKRVLVKGGKLDSKYQITVPEKF